jgi:hypothetical protein
MLEQNPFKIKANTGKFVGLNIGTRGQNWGCGLKYKRQIMGAFSNY